MTKTEFHCSMTAYLFDLGECLGVDSDNESVGDTKSTDEEHLSDKTRKCLFDLFGDDAEAKLGIQIDE